MTSNNLLKEISAWLSFNQSPTKAQLKNMKDDIDKHLASKSPKTEHIEKQIDYLRPFITLDFKVDKLEAQELYDFEYRNNIGGVKDCAMSFNQWLQTKEFEAIDLWVNLQ